MSWKQIIAWDGILPGILAILPLLVQIFARGNDLAVISVVVLVPIIAALVRSSIGYRQFRRLGISTPPLWRQFFLGCAIALLMLCEGTVAIFNFANHEPVEAWVFPAVIYGTYLICIFFAFLKLPERPQLSD